MNTLWALIYEPTLKPCCVFPDEEIARAELIEINEEIDRLARAGIFARQFWVGPNATEDGWVAQTDYKQIIPTKLGAWGISYFSTFGFNRPFFVGPIAARGF